MSGMSFDSINNRVGGAVSQQSAEIETRTSTMDYTNQEDLINLQMEMSQWSTMVTLQTNMVRAVGDALKSVANNVG